MHGNPEECQAERQGTDGDWFITEYDPTSVMNYCNPDWNGNGELSALDIAAIRALYGEPRPPIAARERPMDPQPLKEAQKAVQQRIDLLSPAGGVLTAEQVRTLALLQEVGPLLDQLVHRHRQMSQHGLGPPSKQPGARLNRSFAPVH
jgi:hypothetical protein